MNSHLSLRDLLLYVDGELPSRSRRSAQAHLHCCWRCQAELERLKQDISLIVDAQARSHLLVIPPTRPWANLEEMTAILPSSRFRAGTWFRRANYAAQFGIVRWTEAVAVLVCVLVAALWLMPARLSAEGVLHKLDAADLERTRATVGRAIRQRVQVRRIDRQGSSRGSTELEFWKAGAQSLWRGEDHDLHRLYRDREMDTLLPLSAGACERWLSEAGVKPIVSITGGTVEVRAASEGRDLQSVSVRINSDNWRVEAMRLTFFDRIFEVTELDLTVLKTDELPPQLLVKLQPRSLANVPGAGIARAIGLADKVTVTRSSDGTPAVSLSEVKLRVESRLHRIGADLSEPIELKVQPPRVIIRAPGVSQSRKQQLAELFGNDSRVHLVLDATGKLRGSPLTPVVVLSPPTPQRAPDKQLAAFFGDPDVAERFTREVLTIDGSMLSRLYALKNLAEQWPPEAEATLSDEARGELRGMAEDHRRAVRADLPKLKTLLMPLIERFCNAKVSSVPHPDAPVPWREFAATGLSTVRSLDQYARASLTTSANATGIEGTCPQISGALSLMESQLGNLSPVQ